MQGLIERYYCMKTTKNQADAVRSYLAGLGFEISHCQALEVIARGEGLRSRHVKTDSAGVQAPAVAPVVCPRCAEKATSECGCSSCGTALKDGYCQDSTCLYNDWPQYVRRDDCSVFSTEEVEDMYGIKIRVHGEPELSNSEKLRLHYGEENEHPDYPRGDWLFQASTQRTNQTYWDWVATRLESIDSDELLSDEERSERIRTEYFESGCARSDLEEALSRLVSECEDLFEDEESAMAFLLSTESATPSTPLSAQELAETIKAEYLASRCHADDVDHAVSRLMAECGDLFKDNRRAWQFVMEENHEDSGDEMFVVQMESEPFGREVFVYFTEEERRAGIVRLMAKAVDLNDGVPRDYYFSEIDSDLEKNSPEYEIALEKRRLEGQINDKTEVFYQDKLIGTIAALTEGGLTLYSWIDENP